MKIHGLAILALLMVFLACVRQNPQRMPESQNETLQEWSSSSPWLKLASPKAGDPQTIHSKALVGRAKLVDQEYIIVIDGSKTDGDLDVVRLISVKKPARRAEIKLKTASPNLYTHENILSFIYLPEIGLGCSQVLCRAENGQGMICFETLGKAIAAKCDFAGRTEEVMVLDSNANGRLGDAWVLAKGKDGFGEAVVAGDGICFNEALSWSRFGMPFLRNGVLWNLSIVHGKIVLRRQECPMGEILWKGGDAKTELWLESQTIAITEGTILQNGRWTLPVGEYRLAGLKYRQGNGDVLLMQCAPGAVRTMMVCAGKPLELKPITSVVAKLEYKTKDNSIRFFMRMLTPEGENVVFTEDGAKTHPPITVRMLDVDGREVYKDHFDFGSLGSSSFLWRNPPPLKGEFTIEPMLDASKFPFKVTIEKIKITL